MIHNETHAPGDIVWTSEGWRTIDFDRVDTGAMILRETTRYELERSGLVSVVRGKDRESTPVDWANGDPARIRG